MAQRDDRKVGDELENILKSMHTANIIREKPAKGYQNLSEGQMDQSHFLPSLETNNTLTIVNYN